MCSLSYLYISSSFYHETMMQQRDQGPHNRETRRIDSILLCKVDLTNTARKSPVGPHTPTFPLPASNYRNQPNDIRSAKLNVRPPKVNNASSFLRDYSTTPGVGCGFLYFRSKAVLGLPVSTTSYSRHAVSTVNPRSALPHPPVLNRHRRG